MLGTCAVHVAATTRDFHGAPTRGGYATSAHRDGSKVKHQTLGDVSSRRNSLIEAICADFIVDRRLRPDHSRFGNVAVQRPCQGRSCVLRDSTGTRIVNGVIAVKPIPPRWQGSLVPRFPILDLGQAPGRVPAFTILRPGSRGQALSTLAGPFPSAWSWLAAWHRPSSVSVVVPRKLPRPDQPVCLPE